MVFLGMETEEGTELGTWYRRLMLLSLTRPSIREAESL